MTHCRPASILCLALLLFANEVHADKGDSLLPSLATPVGVDAFVRKNIDERSWQAPGKILFDPIEVAENRQMPSKMARAKILGLSDEDAVRSLAAKLSMIDNARYTIDMVYYIYQRDTVGYAVLASLCNAVKRGVDVRFMVDSLGSLHMTHKELHALQSCENQAGFVLDKNGAPTQQKARVQVVIVNALSKVFVHINRRAHDKLIIVDGHDRERAILMTGGRNISSSYYGFSDDGTADPATFRDMEIVLRPAEGTGTEKSSIGDISTYYYTLLFLNQENKYLREGLSRTTRRDAKELAKADASLALVRNLPFVKARLDEMPDYLATGYHVAKVRLAHELGNLDNKNALSNADENIRDNVNSIQSILAKRGSASPPKSIRIVSPYFFLSDYRTDDGKDSFDSADNLLKLLRDNPDTNIELITNSVMTGENLLVQSVVDMETAPRLLLSLEAMKQWRSLKPLQESKSDLVMGEEWNRMMRDGRLRIYQTGKLDAVELGGNVYYGKLHAKFLVVDDFGFVGTNNFDSRSRFLNNEFGYFINGDAVIADLNAEFERLKARSTQWGSTEWLSVRERMMSGKEKRSRRIRMQRAMFKASRRLGLIWLY